MESKPSHWGRGGRYFDIQQPKTGKVSTNSAGITCGLWQRIFMLQQQERCPSLSAYSELDSKLASRTSAITTKCPRVTSVNHPLWMFITNSGLRILMWLYKCSALSRVISATQVMSCHIFTKWLKWRAVAITVRSSLKYMIMGWHNAGNSGPVLR